MEASKRKTLVHVILKEEEAWILFDWLARFNENRLGLFHDPIEESLLFDLEAVLEKCVPEIVDKDYNDKLLRAREKLRND